MSRSSEQSSSGSSESIIVEYTGDIDGDDNRYGNGITMLPNGDFYVGEYKHGKRHGEGMYQFSDGAQYHGGFVNNLKDGFGTFHYLDGSRYEGYWVKDQKEGLGKYFFTNGDVYEGHWAANKRHGRGTYIYSDGVLYEGPWLEGRMEGVGGVLFFNDYIYKGSFQNNQPIGPGKFVFESLGYEQKGHFVIGQRVRRRRGSVDAGCEGRILSDDVLMWVPENTDCVLLGPACRYVLQKVRVAVGDGAQPKTPPIREYNQVKETEEGHLGNTTDVVAPPGLGHTEAELKVQRPRDASTRLAHS